MALIWEYDYITTTGGAILKDNEGKYVVLDARQVEAPEEGGNFRRRKQVQRDVLRKWFWEVRGIKILPVFFDYDVIFDLLVELMAKMFGVKLAEDTTKLPFQGEKALLISLLTDILGSKSSKVDFNKDIIGKKIADAFVHVDMDGSKLYDIKKDTDVTGAKLNEGTFNSLVSGSKINLVEINRILLGIKDNLEQSNIEVTGTKINEIVKNQLLKGKIDSKALLYLLFDEDGLENANLIDKLTNKELFILLDEDESEEQ